MLKAVVIHSLPSPNSTSRNIIQRAARVNLRRYCLFLTEATFRDLALSLVTSATATERYVRIGFGRLDPDPTEHERRREAHQLLVDEFRKRDPEVAATFPRRIQMRDGEIVSDEGA